MKNKTKEFIHQLQDQISLNSKAVYKEATLAVECAWQNLFQASQILFKCLNNNPIWNHKSVDTSCFLLLTNIQSDILNALLSTLNGFEKGPGLILRSVLENLSVVVVIKKYPDKFDQYLKGKLKPNKTITQAKKIFPEIGEYYGLFSNYFVHEKFEIIGRSIKPVGEDVDFSLLAEIKRDDLPKHTLLTISYLARFSGALSEFCIAHVINDFYYWRKSGNQFKEYKETYEDILMSKLILDIHPVSDERAHKR